MIKNCMLSSQGISFLYLVFSGFSFKGYIKIALIIFPLIIFSPLSFSHGHHNSEKQVDVSLALFEKAIQLSPELLPKEPDPNTPFYQVNGHKIYLNQAFWELTKEWLKLYIQEIEAYCPCDLDLDLMIKESKNYLPKNPLISKISYTSKNITENLLSLGTHLTAKYGYTVAFLKVSAEVAETLLSVFVGGKGIHVLCNAIDVMIFPLARKIQRSFRIFFYGSHFSRSRLVFSARMAWLSRRINKSQKRVFFVINQSLEFNREGLEKLNSQGPKSLLHSKGHRLLWLENLKSKTDSLLDEIQILETELQDPDLPVRDQNRKQKRIQNLKKQIDRLTQLNRNNFFGKRFKRYLWLKSRKSRRSYMSGKDLESHFRFIIKNDFWPLGMQNIIDKATDKTNWNLAHSQIPDNLENQATKSLQNKPNKDEVISGLVEEFLQKVKPDADLNLTKPAVEFFISDLHIIFDTHQQIENRLMSARFVEILLSQFFARYLSLSKKKFLENNESMSFKERMKLHWHFGYVENMAYQFSDFLVAVAIAKQEQKIQFYKYEAIEKFFSFLLYFNEIHLALNKPHLDVDTFFNQLQIKEHSIKSLSLTKEKRTAISIIPFKKTRPLCQKLVRKYQ